MCVFFIFPISQITNILFWIHISTQHLILLLMQTYSYANAPIALSTRTTLLPLTYNWWTAIWNLTSKFSQFTGRWYSTEARNDYFFYFLVFELKSKRICSVFMLFFCFLWERDVNLSLWFLTLSSWDSMFFESHTGWETEKNFLHV